MDGSNGKDLTELRAAWEPALCPLSTGNLKINERDERTATRASIVLTAFVARALLRQTKL